jgi:hypothetical protein
MAFLLWPARAALFEMFTTAAAPTKVYDGPRARGASTPKKYVLVGASVANPAAEDIIAAGGSASQDWTTFGPNERQEAGTIPCTVIAWHGSTEFQALRDAVQEILDACEAALIADPSLGGVLDDLHSADLIDVSVSESQTKAGAAVAAVFTVAYGATTT